MVSIFIKKRTLLLLSIILIVSNGLDFLSTVIPLSQSGQWHREANPVFRVFYGTSIGQISPFVLLLCLKVVVVIFFIWWLGVSMKRIPDNYPPLGNKFGLIAFMNWVAYGRQVSWWKSMFGVPPMRRFMPILSVPISTAVAFSTLVASITNTYGLIHGRMMIWVFWVTTAITGAILGMELMRRDYLSLSRRAISQHEVSSD